MEKHNQTNALILLGEHLRKIRKAKSLRLNDLASRCKLDKAKLSRIENGKINITILTLVDLSTALEMPLKEMMAFSEFKS